MINYPFTNVQSNPWDVLGLGPYTLRGVQSLTPTISYQYDIGRTRGTDAAHVKYVGKQPRRIAVSLLITSEEDFTYFTQDVVPNLAARMDQKEVAPFVITHPQAQLWGIKEVVITDISPAHPNAQSGWNVSINLLEYVSAPKKAKGSKNPHAPSEGSGARTSRQWNRPNNPEPNPAAGGETPQPSQNLSQEEFQAIMDNPGSVLGVITL